MNKKSEWAGGNPWPRQNKVNLPPIGYTDKRKVKLQVPSDTLPPTTQSVASLPPIVPAPPRAPIVIKKPKKMYIAPECNYMPELSSAESEPTPLPEHWKEPTARIQRERASVSDAQAEPKRADDKQQRDSIEEEETEANLPRTFFPLGVDWDANLESQGYGHDVILKSESSDSSDAEDYRNSPTQYVTASDLFHFTKRVTEQEIPTQSLEDSTSSEEIIRKKVQMKQEPPSIKFGENWREDGFLQALETARKRRRKENKEKAKREKHYRDLNNEVRTEGPMIDRKVWRADEPQALKIMRKGTERFRSVEDIYRTLTNEGARNSISFEQYVDQLNTTKEELDRTDVAQRATITEELLAGFCYKNEGTRCANLVLQGKEVFNQIRRRLQDFDLPYIFLFLLKRKDVTYLDLSYNNLTGAGLRLIADYLTWDKRIVGLNLMNNDIENFESPGIDSLIENSTLQSLRLNGNPIGKKGGEFLAFVIMFKNLEHLDLGQTDQEVRSLMWMTQALINNEKLKILDLSRVLPGLINCGSSSFWMASSLAFSDILRLNSSLVELHLQKNGINHICMEEIIFGLGFNKTLELLDISFNQIGDEGAKLMANSLLRGAPLKALMLAGNDIGDVGARALSLHLPKSQLKMLNLANNRIKDQGIIDIVECARKPHPLLAFFIFGNPIGARALEVVSRSVSRGALESVTLDIDLHYCEGEIGHGRNMTADKYEARYYQVSGQRYYEAKQRKNYWPCMPGSVTYKYHNVFNPRAPQPFLPVIQTCPLRGSYCAK